MTTMNQPTTRLSPPSRTAVVAAMTLMLASLAACNGPDSNSTPTAAAPAPATADAPQAAPAAQPVAYTPPTAEQLYQLVAPVALFPDKLLGLTLAGATQPDAITDANNWLGQNRNLSRQDLANAANAQPWDPSVKALTDFPSVLAQMAQNLPWTTDLGQAYAHEPTEVLNAVQVMRQRARAAGNLGSNKAIHVTQTASTVVASSAPIPVQGSVTTVVPAPAETISIEPAQSDVVYVPDYNPRVVYGAPIDVYPRYVYEAPPPAPSYSTGDAIVAGAVTFGLGVAVGAWASHSDWHWNRWGVDWGGRYARPGGPGPAPGPAVVYNNNTYVTQTRVVNNNGPVTVNNTRVDNTTNNTRNIVDNHSVTTINNRPASGPQPSAGTVAASPVHPGPGGATATAAAPPNAHATANPTVPHFTAHDMQAGARPAAVPPGPHGGPAAPQAAAPAHAGAAHPGAPAAMNGPAAVQQSAAGPGHHAPAPLTAGAAHSNTANMAGMPHAAPPPTMPGGHAAQPIQQPAALAAPATAHAPAPRAVPAEPAMQHTPAVIHAEPSRPASTVHPAPAMAMPSHVTMAPEPRPAAPEVRPARPPQPSFEHAPAPQPHPAMAPPHEQRAQAQERPAPPHARQGEEEKKRREP